MVASVSAERWQQSQDALRDEVRRVTTLMRSVSDPRVPAVGQWNIAEVATAFFMVFWQRQSQWNAIAKGQIIAWGRKPWLGLKFRSLIRNP